MKKILFINVILIIFILFLLEVGVYFYENIKIKQRENIFTPFHNGVTEFSTDLFKKNLRKPQGLEYKKTPIIIFGCSFAYGYLLKENQTFSYKLSQLSKRPVYNRAFPGWGIQHMLYQVRDSEFYKEVPKPEYVFFVYMHDHFRRLYTFSDNAYNILNEGKNLRYKLENGKLVRIIDKNPVIKFFKRLYLVIKIHDYFVQRFVSNFSDNYDKYSKFALEHFIESKTEMEKHWQDPNIKYVILFYNDLYKKEDFSKKLEEKGFITVDLYKFTDTSIDSKKYTLPDGHPNEKAWDIITPKLIKTLGL